MSEKIQPDSRVESPMKKATLTRGLGWGLMGGFVGTIAMNLVLVGMLSAAGLPVTAPFSTIGDTAAGFFALIGRPMAGGFPLGLTVYYLLGLVLGGIFGATVARVDALKVNTLKRGIVFAVLYAEILSQPILATSPIILKMPTSETLQWFGMSAVMHLIWGIVLGIVVSYGLRLATTAKHG